MTKVQPKERGFTLIELLMVVAVVGMLAALILYNLAEARRNTKDAAIKEEVTQLENLLGLNYTDYGNYCNLQNGWIAQQGSCSAIFSGTYGDKARELCQSIYSKAKDISGGNGNYRIMAGSSVGCNTSYSLMVNLNNGNWYCSGSSGRKGEYSSYTGQPGCYDNP